MSFILPEGVFSPADIFEKASNASGKFGGVAGVLQGVIWNAKNQTFSERHKCKVETLILH